MLQFEAGRTLVAAHRGVSGANIPCNTLTAFKTALAQGADIVEIDVDKSADGELFIFHPQMERYLLTQDCSLPDMTAAEIAELRYHNQDNVPTQYGIEKLEDILLFLKDKAYINVDKYWMYIEEITAMIRKCGVENQVIVKLDDDLEKLNLMEKCAPDLAFMPVLSRKDTYTEHALEKNVRYIGAEVLFETDADEIVSDAYIKGMHDKGLMLFANAIVYNDLANIAAGHTDDVALAGDLETGWGWYIKKGIDIIQTDWCGMLKQYIQGR